MYKGDLFEVRLYMVRCSQILPRFFHHNGLIGFPKLGNELHQCMAGAELHQCMAGAKLHQTQFFDQKSSKLQPHKHHQKYSGVKN